MARRLLGFILVVFAAAVVGTSALAVDKLAAVPAGASLRVRLETTLTDKTNKTGDKFFGAVTDPVTADGKDVIPAGSAVEGHVAFVKPSGRFKGKAEMRLVVDKVTTTDEVVYALAGTLEDAQGGVCGSTAVTGKSKPADEEGTITGCGKSKKDAAKDAALGSAMGAGAGATVGLGHEIDCSYFGNCGGPSMGADIGYGAAAGAGTVLVYNLFKHEKHIILVQGMHLTFMVNRTTSADANATAAVRATDQ